MGGGGGGQGGGMGMPPIIQNMIQGGPSALDKITGTKIGYQLGAAGPPAPTPQAPSGVGAAPTMQSPGGSSDMQRLAFLRAFGVQ